jgi:hypothetical protein
VKAFVVLAAALMPFSAMGDEQEIQRSVIQRDQQSAEFAARVRGADTSRLEQLHARQLIEAARPIEPNLRPDQRQKMADERALVLPPPSVTLAKPVEKPLPLPGGPRHGVDPIPAQGPGN